ncbi:MAG: ABC transporter substrate-binding protein [Neomegalonema sp.]|nr:ABC transporter substrate-binding protein [Neomegalonema sp.]
MRIATTYFNWVSRHTYRLSAGCVATLLCCASITPANAFDVVFVNPGSEGELFWDMTTKAMHSAAEDLGHRVEVLYAQRDRYRMRDLAEKVIERADPPDYLILVNEEQFASALLPKADAAGIRTLLLLNGVIGDESKKLGAPGEKLRYWLGALTPDNEGAGRRMAERGLAEARRIGLIDKNGVVSVLALGGDKTTPASIHRQRGALDAITTDAKARLERVFFARWSRDAARKMTAKYIDHAGHAPGLIWAANDEMALGAIEALEAKGYRPGRDAVIVGLNWSSEALERVKKGEMLLSDGGHFLGGAWAIVALHDYHSAPSKDLSKLRQRLSFDMAAIDSAALKALGGEAPVAALHRLDFSRFSTVRSGPKALPLCLRAYLKATAKYPAALSDAHALPTAAAERK